MERLPEEVFVHILSFLPTFDAVKVCSLSRRWRNLWQLNPNLEFDIFPFHYHFKYKNYNPPQTRNRFVSFVSRALHRRPQDSPPPHKFQLLCHDTGHQHADVDSWLFHAIHINKVREIDLDFDITYHKFNWDRTRNYDDSYGIGDDDPTGYAYTFNFSHLVNSSVHDLKLRDCALAFPTLTRIRVESLKSIHLMDFELEDYELTQILSVCVNLEYLRMEPVWGLTNLKIVSPKLKELKLCYFSETDVENRSLEIDAPCLCSITLDSFCMGKYIWKCVPSLVEAHVQFESRVEESDIACWRKMLPLISRVQRLTTQNMWIWSQSGKVDEFICSDDERLRKKPKLEGNEVLPSAEKDFHGKLSTGNNICPKSFVFNNLKHLELLTGYTQEDLLGLEIMFGTCPRLETVVLVYSYKTLIDVFLEEAMEERPIILHLPCLRLVKMKRFRGSKNELYVVGLLKSHGMVLEKIVAFPAKIDDEAFVL